MTLCIPIIVRVDLFHYLVFIYHLASMMPLPLSVIDVVLLVEIFRLYFYIIFSNLCADIFIKISVSAIIT